VYLYRHFRGPGHDHDFWGLDETDPDSSFALSFLCPICYVHLLRRPLLILPPIFLSWASSHWYGCIPTPPALRFSHLHALTNWLVYHHSMSYVWCLYVRWALDLGMDM
jgi:hypothetical protein